MIDLKEAMNIVNYLQSNFNDAAYETEPSNSSGIQLKPIPESITGTFATYIS